MADKKISELVELTTPSATDKLPIVDGTETKYIEYQNLVTNQVEDSITNGVTDKAPSQNAVFDALALKQDNLGFTPENSTNKTNTVAGNEASTSLYLSVKGYYDYLIGLTWLTATRFGTWVSGLSAKTTPLDSDTIIVNDGDAKKTTLTQFKAFLKTYFDTIYGSAFSGTTNTIPKFTSSTAIGNSRLKETTDNLEFTNTTGSTIFKIETTATSQNSRVQAVKGLNVGQIIAYDTAVDLFLAQGRPNSIVTRIITPQYTENNDALGSTRNINGTLDYLLICPSHSAFGEYGNAHGMLASSGQYFRSHKRFTFANDRASSNYKEVFRIDVENHRVVLFDNTNTNPVEKIRFDANSQNNIQLTTGAKIGNNTDTAIVAGAGSVKYNAGKLSFSNGTNWGDIENDRNIVTPISTYTILSTDHILLNNQSSTWTLPSNTSLIGKKYLIYLNNNTLTLNSDGVDLLNGAFFLSFGASYKAIEVRCLASGVWLTNMV